MAEPTPDPETPARYSIDLGKIVVLVCAIAATTALGIAGVLDKTATGALLSLCIGYVAGNGRIAMTGRRPAGIIAATDDHPNRSAVILTAATRILEAETRTDERKDGEPT